MSNLEVLQNFPSQRQALFSAIGGVDPKDSNLVSFDHKGYDPQLPAQLAFLIQVKALNKTFHRTIIDEGASTCIMSMNCWKTLGSPTLLRSPTTLKAFDGRTYTPYGILNNLKVELGGKTVEIDVEVIDGNLDYNILLGIPWIYAMAAVVSTYFRKIAFPFEGGITVVDQQNFLPNGSQVTGSIPMIHGSDHSLRDIGVGLLKDPTMMGTFALPQPIHIGNIPLIATCNMISSTRIAKDGINMDHAMVLPPSPVEIL
ncbi:MAG: retroviral-like aspartic protease [Rhodobacteraceae bacterium]|nr:retroviral-like aspartic protease [Paracoccaceae bacterium]